MKFNTVKENYNIKVNLNIFKCLEQDIDNFNLKNRNRLINRIVSNYVDVKNTDDVYEKIIKNIDSYIKEDVKTKEMKKVIKNSIYSTIKNIKGTNRETLNFRLSRDTINKCTILGETPDYFDTDFFRGVFEWYVSKPKHKREEVIFFEEVKDLKNAIKNSYELKLEVKIKNKKILKLDKVYPLGYFSSKDENYNYLITFNPAEKEEKVYATRLSNILTLLKIARKFEVNQKIRKKAESRIENKHYTWDELKRIKIKLTKEGYSKYKTISHLRPKHLEDKEREDENGNFIFTFNESEDTMLYYFTQFGKEFEVIEPQTLKEKFKIFYEEAFSLYN